MTAADRWSGVDLELALREAGRAIDWPEGRDVAAAVEARLVARTTQAVAPSGWGRFRPSLAGRARLVRRSTLLALAALLLLAAIAAAVGLGVPGIRLMFVPAATPSASVPAATGGVRPSGSGPAASGPIPSIALPGRSIPLADAVAQAGFTVAVPAEGRLGALRDIRISGDPPLARLAFVYDSGSVLTEFVGTADPDAFTKIIGGGTTVEPLTIGGAPAYWLSGDPHELVIHYRLPDGTDRWETTTAGDVLIWTRGALTLRLETTLGRAVALDVARSMH